MRTRASTFLLFSVLVSGPAFSGPVIVDISSFGTSQISFNGTSGALTFSPDAGGYDFQIVDSNLPGLVGLLGNIDGTFSIGSITTSGFLQDAPTTGTGTFSISDGSDLFTAAVSWVGAETFGASGSLNTDGVPNLDNFSYSGSNTALQEFAGDSSAIASVSFQFVPAESLSQLASGGDQLTTSYSGSIESVPEVTSTVSLLGAALLALALARRRLALGSV